MNDITSMFLIKEVYLVDTNNERNENKLLINIFLDHQ